MFARIARAVFFLTAFCAGLLPAYGVQAAARNVLLLIADDLGVDATEFYPTSVQGVTVRRVTNPPAPPMPNLKRLAQQGVLFSKAWAYPLCAPSRAALFTGRYGFRTGVGTNPNDAHLPKLALSEVLLPELFTARPALNYLLGHIGKWHVSDGNADPNRYGWPYFAGGLPERAGLELYFSWKKDVNGVVGRSTTYATTDQVNEALGLIRKAKGPPARPYFVQVAFNAPHEPYHVPPRKLYTSATLPPYASGKAPRPYFEAMVEALDSEIGRLLSEVDLANTTVIFLGDNGTTKLSLASPYPANRAKGTVYETGIRVPLLIAGSSVVSPGRLATGVVNTVDLFPTILALTGIPLPGGVKLDGVSLLPDLQNSSGGTRRSWAYAEQFSSQTSFQRAIRNATYKLIERSGGGREFYDLTADPFEARNLLGGTLTATQQSNLDSLNGQLDALIASR
jgi:arylsulfatase B